MRLRYMQSFRWPYLLICYFFLSKICFLALWNKLDWSSCTRLYSSLTAMNSPVSLTNHVLNDCEPAALDYHSIWYSGSLRLRECYSTSSTPPPQQICPCRGCKVQSDEKENRERIFQGLFNSATTSLQSLYHLQSFTVFRLLGRHMCITRSGKVCAELCT